MFVLPCFGIHHFTADLTFGRRLKMRYLASIDRRRAKRRPESAANAQAAELAAEARLPRSALLSQLVWYDFLRIRLIAVKLVRGC